MKDGLQTLSFGTQEVSSQSYCNNYYGIKHLSKTPKSELGHDKTLTLSSMIEISTSFVYLLPIKGVRWRRRLGTTTQTTENRKVRMTQRDFYFLSGKMHCGVVTNRDRSHRTVGERKRFVCVSTDSTWSVLRLILPIQDHKRLPGSELKYSCIRSFLSKVLTFF